VDNVQFIDFPVVESQITSSDVRNMPSRQSGHLEYNLLQEERSFLADENTCVIDNLVGWYGEELKLNKDNLLN
jgi:hypothetical protein